ncbi:nucleotidyl transferase AbiEii/AbiGii toxin family protein [Lacihabitans soyangensis]|uniref:Nucleotidyl transferase AbiEii/AbiGii toxin family protein n=1 Tax=Lacihabitans soyangensis TaxID=869394 RepID=A0AAE3KWG5_9BACT|nr:nucleotidyl transferase AbiEii/AbiGii toxin family protein [Lacihabitans soyangensis]MCP9765666.1 nucleotidyl transferase AbiEii/AbiGii toxin family protein [Lacihabitans soyangensis]
MIPQSYITAWRKQAPWQENYQVEQDLIIQRALIALFNDDLIKDRLAFRGGTALHKLYLAPAARYSEDIDLVQIKAEPFGEIIDRVRVQLAFLGTPRVNQKLHNNTIVYRVLSEDDIPIKLKIEVNTREHFSVYGLQNVPVKLESDWDNGEALVPTYGLDELLATKLRALYQRKKGRDLFDLWYALKNANVDTERLVAAFKHYMHEEGNAVTQKDFMENMEKKIEDADFVGDMNGLLRSGISYDINEAYEFVKKEILEKI